MKKLIGVLGTFFLVVSFQNCSHSNMSTSEVMQAGTGIDGAHISTKEYSKIVVWNPNRQIYLDVNMNDGKMRAFEQNGQPLDQNFCMSSSELSELKTLLASSEICEPKVDYEAIRGRLCTAVYNYPYFSIVTDHTEYRLGEMNSGCDVPVDLCGDRAQMLKNFSTAIIKNLDDRLCQ